MKQKMLALAAALCLLGTAGCGKTEQGVDVPGNAPVQAEETVEPESLAGEYVYSSENGTGKLVIDETDGGYDISDYESESSYRFLADSSNIETIENNKIYIKYPEQIFSDDTVVFGYYILEYSPDEITAYYGKTGFEEAQFLYHATRSGAR